MVPPYLKAPLPLLPLARVEDAFIVLRPFVLVALYWVLLRRARGAPVEGRAMAAFLFIAIVLVYGLGLHDAANSIGRLVPPDAGDGGALTYFFDEVASHVLWHVGIMAASVLLVWSEIQYGVRPDPVGWTAVVAGVLYGVTFFLVIIEGATALIGLPFAVAFSIAIWMNLRRRGGGRLSTLFLVGHAVASLLFIAWGVYWRGFPEPSQLKMI